MCFGSSPDYTGAAAQEAAAAQQASATEMQMFQQAEADVAPWRQGGTAAVNQIAGLEGLPGYTAVDPTKTLQATPGYQWGLSQGIGAMDASAASKGLALSGPQRNATQQYGQNYALQNAWTPYMNTLQSLSGQGLQAGTSTGNWAIGTGQQVGQNTMAAAQAQAQAQIQQQNASNQQMGGWMQGIGMLGSLIGSGFGMNAGVGQLFGGSGGGWGSMLGMGGGGGGSAASYLGGANSALAAGDSSLASIAGIGLI